MRGRRRIARIGPASGSSTGCGIWRPGRPLRRCSGRTT
nr:MAG TPA: hypothetical protein [Caudoviricetes sp.]